MGNKRNRNESEDRIVIPIYIPTNDGVGEIVLGNAELRGDTLLVNFNDYIPAQAIKHRIQRGGIVGLTFVIPEEENAVHEENEAEIAKRQQEARDLADLEKLKGVDELTPDDLQTD